MSDISTHVLDAVLGKPAAGLLLRMERREGSTWIEIAVGTTDKDGRCRNLMQHAEPGVYRLTFDSATYLQSRGRTSIYPEISITFICDGQARYHLPLLLSDNSYTTYRGS